MLTDYHLHLRPDDVGEAAEDFTEENVERYLAAAAEARDRRARRLRAHLPLHRGARALAPPLLGEPGHATTSTPTASSSRTTPLKLGIEADFIRGAEDRTADAARGARLRLRASARSTSSATTAPSTTAATTSGRPIGDPDALWRRYFEWIAEAARSGLFDILAHPDLVKLWGDARPLPERDPRHYYEPAVEAIAETGIAVEVSTAGLRKHVGEIYPSRAFAEMCVEAGAAFALSSDAHAPDQVGFGYDQALEFLAELGVEEICVFEGRERRLEPIGRVLPS